MVAPTESAIEKYYPYNVRTFLQGSELSVIRQWQQLNSVDLSVAMFNAIRDFNLASVIRNAEVFGLRKVHIIGWRKYDKRGTVGAHHLIDIEHHKDFESFVEAIGLQNVVPIEHPDQYDLDNMPVPVSDYKFRQGHCLLLGEEGRGIPSEYLEKFPRYCYIPQYGATRSLNAAVASGIVMHAARMRLEK